MRDAARRRAAGDVATWRADPATLPQLALGAFDHAPLVQVVSRRILLALRAPRWVVARIAPPALEESYRYWHAVRKLVDRDTWRRLTGGTTILMYHAFALGGERASRFVIPRRSFERQVRWLARRRPVIGLDELLAYRRAHQLPPPRAVVVTIDDGYEDAATVGGPALRAGGVPATLFVVTRLMGRPSDWNTDPLLERRPLLTWEAARALRGDGIALGGHTRTHPALTERDGTGLDDEVGGSRADLEDALGEPVETFAYPYGKWNEAAAEAVARAGFGCAVTVDTGRNCAATPPFALRRAEIRGGDSFLRFRLAVVFGDAEILSRLFRRLRGR